MTDEDNTPNTTDLQFKPTGKMSIIIDTESWGPVQWRINDIDTVISVMEVIMALQTFDVDAYDDETNKVLNSLIDDIKE